MFYRQLFIDEIENSGADDIVYSGQFTVLINLMLKNNGFSTEPIKTGLVSTTEKDVMLSKYKDFISKPTNDDLYDFLYYLDSKGKLDEYLARSDKIMPCKDTFYDDMNEKLGIETKDTYNYCKVCPKCGLIPFTDFSTVCSMCLKESD